jgi:biopolymer transport protein TolR
MGLVAKKRARAVPAMNVTPLVDVVLVLLIIFMVVIPAMEKSPQIALPDIFNPDPEAKGKTDPFTLSITPDGKLYFEKEEVSEADLERRLREAQTNEPGRRLVLRADRTANYVDVRKLFKIVQTIGFPGVSMRVNSLKQDDEK